MTEFVAEMVFGFIAAAHFLLMIYTILRRFARPAEARCSYTYVPRTTFFIAETPSNGFIAYGTYGKDRRARRVTPT